MHDPLVPGPVPAMSRPQLGRRLLRVAALHTLGPDSRLSAVTAEILAGMIDGKDSNGHEHGQRLKHPKHPLMQKCIPLGALGELADAINATNLPPTLSVPSHPSTHATKREHTRIMADDT